MKISDLVCWLAAFAMSLILLHLTVSAIDAEGRIAEEKVRRHTQQWEAKP